MNTQERLIGCVILLVGLVAVSIIIKANTNLFNAKEGFKQREKAIKRTKRAVRQKFTQKTSRRNQMEKFETVMAKKQKRDRAEREVEEVELEEFESVPADATQPMSNELDQYYLAGTPVNDGAMPFSKRSPYENSGPKQMDGTHSMFSYKGAECKPEYCGSHNGEVGGGASCDKGCIGNNEFYTKRNNTRGGNNRFNENINQINYGGDLTFGNGDRVTDYDPAPAINAMKEYKPLYLN